MWKGHSPTSVCWVILLTVLLAAPGCITSSLNSSRCEKTRETMRVFPEKVFLTDSDHLVVCYGREFRLDGKRVKPPFHFDIPLSELPSGEEEMTIFDLADCSPVPGLPTDEWLAEVKAVEVPVSQETVAKEFTEHELEADHLDRLRQAVKEPSTPVLFDATRIKPKPMGSVGFAFYTGDKSFVPQHVFVGLSSHLETAGETCTRTGTNVMTLPIDIVTSPIQLLLFAIWTIRPDSAPW